MNNKDKIILDHLPKAVGVAYKFSKSNNILPLLRKATPKGWIADTGFNSQDSFFTKGNKSYARTVIRRWVKKNTEKKNTI